jgi:hypothetical protein
VLLVIFLSPIVFNVLVFLNAPNVPMVILSNSMELVALAVVLLENIVVEEPQHVLRVLLKTIVWVVPPSL